MSYDDGVVLLIACYIAFFFAAYIILYWRGKKNDNNKDS